MNIKKYLTLFVLFISLIGGVWLLGRPGELAPESLTRVQALSPLLNSGAGQAGDEAPPGSEVIVHDPVVGSAIDLSELPEEVDNGDSMYQRWLNGEIDLDEEESLLTPEQQAELIQTMADPGPSPNIQQPINALESILLKDSFPGPDLWKCCTSTNQAVVPPDPELAAGPNHLIAAVNIAFEIYNKQGQVLSPNRTFANLFSGIGDCDTLQYLYDPNVLYDEQADRFFLGIAHFHGYYCTAVSASNDPTGTWYRYKFQTNLAGGTFDYPHAGIGRDAIYMGGNIFNCGGGGCTFRDSRIWALNKAQMYANAPTAVVERGIPDGTNSNTPQPANLHGYAQGTWPTGGPHYFIVGKYDDGALYAVFAWNDPFGANNLNQTGQFNLTAATGVQPIYPFTAAQQLGSNARLRTNDWRPLDNEYRNGYLWTTNTISCNPGGGVVTCVRWAQVNPANGNIVQAGILGSNNEYRYFGDVAANHCNDMTMGYTKSSSSTYAGIWVAGREGGDPPNTLQGEALMKAGERSYYSFDPAPHRWGDYTGMTIDPNGRDFWYLGQYSKNISHPAANWGTYIGCYAPTTCIVPTDGASPQTAGSGSVEPPPTLPEGFDQFSYLPLVAFDPTPPQINLPCGFIP